jgi:hypothetical protein
VIIGQWLPLECLSRMSGNYHVRFLGGNEAVTPPTYPVWQYVLAVQENEQRYRGGGR